MRALFLLLGHLLVGGFWVKALAVGMSWVWLALLGVQFCLLPVFLARVRTPRLSTAALLRSTEEQRDETPASEGGTTTGDDRTRPAEREGQERKGEEEEEEKGDDGGGGGAVEEEKLSLLALRDFYVSQVCREREEAPQDLCELVQGLLEALVRRIQGFGPCCQAALGGRCQGVGSMFEGWGANRGRQIPVYDLLVFFGAPEGLRLEVELQFGQQRSTEATSDNDNDRDDDEGTSEAPPPEVLGTASVHVRADPEQPRARSFASRSRLEDFVTRARSERIREGLDYLLEECFTLDQGLDPARLLVWLGGALRRAWTFRGGVKLSFWGQENPCVMRLQTSAGRVLYLHVMPAVRVPASDLCVVARAGGGAGATTSDPAGRWETWFCSDEESYLRRLTRALPAGACHLTCLELLAYLARPVAPFSPRAATFLSSYHLKTALLHLLQKYTHTHAHAHRHTHTDAGLQLWSGPCLLERLEEMLLLLQTGVAQRRLLSFWVGNPALGQLGPPALRSVAPLNLFWALEQPAWAALAEQELGRLSLRLHQLPTRAALSHLSPHQPSSSSSAEGEQGQASGSGSGWTAGLLNSPGLRAVTHSHTLRAVTQKLSQAAERRSSLSRAAFQQLSSTHTAED